MSSRELLDDLLGLITEDNMLVTALYLPEESALNTALRGGDWSAAEYREARIINELAAGRADGTDMKPEFLQSPMEIFAEKAQADWQRQKHDENVAQLKRRRVSSG